MFQGGRLLLQDGHLCGMKKAAILLLLFAACKSDSRTYVNYTKNQYATVHDTLLFSESLIIRRTGYQKIRSGHLQPKQFKVRQWHLNSPGAPVIRFDRKRAYWNNTIYVRIP